MNKPLTIQILEYLNFNTENHNQIDIIPFFSDKLLTLQNRSDFIKSIKELKKNDYILTGTEYIMLAVQGPPNGSVLNPLIEVKVYASITINGDTFLRSLENKPTIHLENSPNSIVGNQNDYRPLKTNQAINSPNTIPSQKTNNNNWSETVKLIVIGVIIGLILIGFGMLKSCSAQTKKAKKTEKPLPVK